MKRGGIGIGGLVGVGALGYGVKRFVPRVPVMHPVGVAVLGGMGGAVAAGALSRLFTPPQIGVDGTVATGALATAGLGTALVGGGTYAHAMRSAHYLLKYPAVRLVTGGIGLTLGAVAGHKYLGGDPVVPQKPKREVK
jgi:hypothetical protein